MHPFTHFQTCTIIFLKTFSSISFLKFEPFFTQNHPVLASRLGMGALPGVSLLVRSSHTTRRSATYFSRAIPLRPALAASGLFIFIIREGCCFGLSFLLVPPFD